MDSLQPAVWKLPDELRQMADSGDARIVADILSVFQRDTASRLEQLRTACIAGDKPLVERQAHTVKGSAGQVGAEALAAACLQLEVAAKHGRCEEIPEKLAAVESAFAEACEAINHDGNCSPSIRP